MSRRSRSDWSTYMGEQDRLVLENHLVEENSVSLVTALAEVLITLPNDQRRWHKMDCGVLCFIKDYTFRSYYFRLFSLDFCAGSSKPELLWEQELSFPFNYNKVTSKFHYFGTNFGYVSFNFMFEDEAVKTLQVITDKINVKKYNRLKKMQNVKNEETSNHVLQQSLLQTSISTSEINGSAERASSTPLRRMKSSLTRSISNSSVMNFLKTKIGKRGEKKALSRSASIDKSQIGLPTEPRLVKHGGCANGEYEKRFRDILVELNMSFQERSMSGSQCGSENGNISRSEDNSFEELNVSGMRKPPGAGKRFAPPPPPREADPNELVPYLGKKANQMPFPFILTPPVSPITSDDAVKDKSIPKSEMLVHCSLSPIERTTSPNPHKIQLSPSEDLNVSEIEKVSQDDQLDFNAKIGFKGFTNKIYLTPKLKSVYEPSFISPAFNLAEETSGETDGDVEARNDAFLLDKLRAELIRQAPYLACQSDDEE